MKKVFDSEPVYNEKNLKTQITPHEGKINTHFHGNKIPKEVFELIYLLVTSTNYVFTTGKNYYSQMCLEQCKYVAKERA